MSRTAVMSPAEAKLVWVRLWKAKGRKPTVLQFTKALGVKSTRTGFRYLQRIDDSRVCAHCGGRGYVR